MADYNMRNSGASVDDAVENYLDKRVGGVVVGNVEATEFISDVTNSDVLATKDGSVSVDMTTVAHVNLINLALGTLPTADPAIIGRLWVDAGVVKVSL